MGDKARASHLDDIDYKGPRRANLDEAGYAGKTTKEKRTLEDQALRDAGWSEAEIANLSSTERAAQIGSLRLKDLGSSGR